jgi:N-acetylmuramoyl-L-alanine amidase
VRRFLFIPFCVFFLFSSCLAAPKKIVDSSTFAARAPIPLKTKNPLIFIDPGHGGEDYGTNTLEKPKVYEKNLTLSTAKLVYQYLKKRGYRVVMTREGDQTVSLKERASLANKGKAALFVSIHYNSAPNRSADGIEVYYFKSENDRIRSLKSKMLAEDMLRRCCSSTGAKVRGVKHGNFAVIRDTNMPAILIEGGFLTNSKEQENIRTAHYQRALSQAIAASIDQYARRNLRL